MVKWCMNQSELIDVFSQVYRWWIFCYFFRDLGAKVSFLSNKELAQMFPWLNVSGVEAGVLGRENEGWWVEENRKLFKVVE